MWDLWSLTNCISACNNHLLPGHFWVFSTMIVWQLLGRATFYLAEFYIKILRHFSSFFLTTGVFFIIKKEKRPNIFKQKLLVLKIWETIALSSMNFNRKGWILILKAEYTQAQKDRFGRNWLTFDPCVQLLVRQKSAKWVCWKFSIRSSYGCKCWLLSSVIGDRHPVRTQ